ILFDDQETVGSIMQRVLGGYSRYYNRRYKHVGHVFQGRHKSILCQSERYLGELVRYIHLNPVRARMVSMPEAIHTAVIVRISGWSKTACRMSHPNCERRPLRVLM
ncbi:MAG TPA: hypothetical protein VK468_02505, partial [Pyrinomonadaceae bacterium]|nr:hypothetical protein [Pyrinomonadaceae bacterium]